jgi:Tfp pilus assembly protein PilF
MRPNLAQVSQLAARDGNTIFPILAILAISTIFAIWAPAPTQAQPNMPYMPSSTDPQARAKSQIIFDRAVQAFQMGDYGATVNLLKAAEPIDAGNKAIFNLEALAYSELGDNYNANTKFRQALSLDYNYVACRNNYGVFLNKTGKVKEAQKAFEECIRSDPRYPDAHYHLGQIMQAKGDLDKAIDSYLMATQLKPSYVDAQRDLGLAMYEKAVAGGAGVTMDDAVARLKTAAHYAPDNPLVWYHLGRILCSQGGLDEAESAFRTGLMKDPKLAAGQWELGKLRYLRGDPYRAIDQCGVVDKISPVYTDGKQYPKVDLLLVYSLLAISYETVEDWEHADATWRKVASLQSNNAETVKHLAELRHQLKATSKRRKDQVDPGEIQALIWKGVEQVDNGDLPGGKTSFERAVELDSHSFGGEQNLGQLLEAGGDLNNAMAKYQAAMALKPRFDGAYYNMAYVLEKMGLGAEAGIMYQKFHELAGRYPYDPKHIVSLQQDEARQRARDELKRRRGY